MMSRSVIIISQNRSLHASTTRLSSSRLHHPSQHTRQLPNKPSLKAKRRLLSTYWLKNQKKLATIPQLLQPQLHQLASQRYTSSNTRHRRNREAAPVPADTLLVGQLVILAALISVQLHQTRNQRTESHTRSKRPS